MFFNSMNLSAKVVVTNLGQDFASFVVALLFSVCDLLWIFVFRRCGV